MEPGGQAAEDDEDVVILNSDGQTPEEGDIIDLSDDEDGVGDGGNSREDVAAATNPFGSASAASARAGNHPIGSPSATSASTPSRRSSRIRARKSAASTDPAIPASPAAPSISARRGASPGTPLSPATPAKQGADKESPARTPATSTTARRVASPAERTPSAGHLNRGGGGPSATPGSTSAPKPTMRPTNVSGPQNANRNATTATDRDAERAAQLETARKRNSHLQKALSTPGCVLSIYNLELDVQPQDMLGQLVRFDNNNSKVLSVHVPPPYPELNHAVGYVVFLKTEYADAAASFLTRNFAVSARGRPWVISRCTQTLNESDFGFPTLSAFMGEGDGGVNGGLKIVTAKQEAEYTKAKERLALFEQHKKQRRLLFERHTQEDKDMEENPDSIA